MAARRTIGARRRRQRRRRLQPGDDGARRDGVHAGAPVCLRCPVRAGCRAHAAASVSRFPAPKSKREPRAVDALAVLIERRSRLLLLRRPPSGLWGGLWEPPWQAVHTVDEEAAATRRERLYRSFADEHPSDRPVRSRADPSTHALPCFCRARPRPGRARRLRCCALAAAQRGARGRRRRLDAPTAAQGDEMTKRQAAAAKLEAAYTQILEAFADLGYPGPHRRQLRRDGGARGAGDGARWSSPPTRSRRRSTRC